LLYWYKSTNTDAEGAGACGQLGTLTLLALLVQKAQILTQKALEGSGVVVTFSSVPLVTLLALLVQKHKY
jgi:hypothetical protein